EASPRREPECKAIYSFETLHGYRARRIFAIVPPVEKFGITPRMFEKWSRNHARSIDGIVLPPGLPIEAVAIGANLFEGKRLRPLIRRGDDLKFAGVTPGFSNLALD